MSFWFATTGFFINGIIYVRYQWDINLFIAGMCFAACLFLLED